MDFKEVSQANRLADAFKKEEEGTSYEWQDSDGGYIKISPDIAGSGSNLQSWTIELGVPIDTSGREMPNLPREPTRLPNGDQYWEILQNVLSWAPKRVDRPNNASFLRLERADDSYHDTYRAYYRGTVHEKTTREKERTV